jgi:dienelactone hydrolase
MRRWGVAILLLLAACSGAWAQERVRVPSRDEGVMLDAYLFRAPGEGSHPAALFLHGCGGLVRPSGAINARELDWAARLNQAGYSVLMIDSFSTRHIGEMCSSGSFRPGVYRWRSEDAYGALLWLQAQPFVRPDQVALIGWSLGGGTTMFAVGHDSPGRPPVMIQPDFRAAIAFYPGSCRAQRLGSGWSTSIPLLVLNGEADVWTPAVPCKEVVDAAAAKGAPVAIHLYPGAYHDFDWPGQAYRELTSDRTAGGVVPIVAMDPAAMADAHHRVLDFLASLRASD